MATFGGLRSDGQEVSGKDVAEIGDGLEHFEDYQRTRQAHGRDILSGDMEHGSTSTGNLRVHASCVGMRTTASQGKS